MALSVSAAVRSVDVDLWPVIRVYGSDGNTVIGEYGPGPQQGYISSAIVELPGAGKYYIGISAIHDYYDQPKSAKDIAWDFDLTVLFGASDAMDPYPVLSVPSLVFPETGAGTLSFGSIDVENTGLQELNIIKKNAIV